MPSPTREVQRISRSRRIGHRHPLPLAATAGLLGCCIHTWRGVDTDFTFLTRLTTIHKHQHTRQQHHRTRPPRTFRAFTSRQCRRMLRRGCKASKTKTMKSYGTSQRPLHSTYPPPAITRTRFTAASLAAASVGHLRRNRIPPYSDSATLSHLYPIAEAIRCAEGPDQSNSHNHDPSLAHRMDLLCNIAPSSSAPRARLPRRNRP